MAKTRGRIPQPKGGKITVGPEERVRLKDLRETKGLKQGELAAKIGVTQGTISNLESGRHPQMARDKYAALIRVLGADSESMSNEEAYRRLMNAGSVLSGDQLATAVTIVEALAAAAKKR
jgi:transcriptional regulator with XRE-family HTH domain